MDLELEKNLTFVETKSIQNEYKKGHKNCFILHGVPFFKNKQLFIRNLRISGLKILKESDPNNAIPGAKGLAQCDIHGSSGFQYIDLEIGGSIIDRIYGPVYEVIKKRHGINETENGLVKLPYDVIPYAQYHTIQITYVTAGFYIESDYLKYDKDSKVTLYYDIYSYDTTKTNKDLVFDDDYHYYTGFENDPDDSRVLKANSQERDCFCGAFRYQRLLEQLQFTSEPYYNRYRLNFNHVINCLAIDVPQELENEIYVSFNKCEKIKLPFSYRVGSFAVYELPWINFSKLDNVVMYVDLPTDDPNKTLNIYAFNKQPLRFISGMCGLPFSK
jgi:hypothetical protein